MFGYLHIFVFILVGSTTLKLAEILLPRLEGQSLFVPLAAFGLGAFLFAKKRAFLPLLLGSFSGEILSHLLCGTELNIGLDASNALALVVGSYSGAYFLRRAVSYPSALSKPEEAWRAMLAGAFGASIVSASVISFGSFLVLGNALFERIGMNIFSHSVGVLLLLPLLWSQFGRPRFSWRPRRYLFAAALAVSLVSVYAGFGGLYLDGGNPLVARQLVSLAASLAGVALFTTLILMVSIRIDEFIRRNQDVERELVALSKHSSENSSKLEKAQEEIVEQKQTKENVLRNVSHELRTPLTAILGFTPMLAGEDLSSDEREKYTKIIQNNGQHLLALINNILDASDLQSGDLGIDRENFAAQEFLDDAIGVYYNQARKKGLEFKWGSKNEIPNEIYSDPVRLRQIIGNIILNAIEFTDEGEINLSVECDYENEILSFCVEDSGCGMSEKQMEHVFEAFSQSDSTMTREHGGTGVGLMIASRLVELLGGSIKVESELGVGSKLSFSVATGPLQSVETQKADGDLTGMDILVVEDTPETRRLVELLLAKGGAVVTTAENGQIAVEQVAARKNAATDPAREDFDLIFMDLQMPVMSGYDAIEALRKLGYEAPIVALTAHALPEERQRCLSLGSNDFMNKPVRKKSLINMADQFHPQRLVSTSES